MFIRHGKSPFSRIFRPGGAISYPPAVYHAPRVITRGVISGTGIVGSLLSEVSPAIWDGTTYIDQEWFRGDTGTGLTAGSYLVQPGDVGVALNIRFTAHNTSGLTTVSRSNAIVGVPAP